MSNVVHKKKKPFFKRPVKKTVLASIYSRKGRISLKNKILSPIQLKTFLSHDSLTKTR